MEEKSRSYSQWKAFKALVKASLISLIKSPSTVIFTIAFPLVFIFGFGFISTGDSLKVKVAIDKYNLENDDLLKNLSSSSVIEWTYFNTINGDSILQNGLADVVIKKNMNVPSSYMLHIDNTHKEEAEIVAALIKSQNINPSINVITDVSDKASHNPVDFILTGQLGFSLIAASVFGVAFVFFGLRQDLVLKRFFSTPIKRWNILLAEGFARMLFQLVGAAILLAIGYIFLDFNFINGWLTFINLIIMSAIGVMVFMSFGFVISGLAKSIGTVPPFANIFVLPQFILAGTFIPIDRFPTWIQWISNMMPLTYLNNAFRKIAIDGAGLFDLGQEILMLLIWAIIGYALASRLFKWQ